MKLALLLPGFVDSPDYLHLKLFDRRLATLGYRVLRLDPGGLWKTGDVSRYTVTTYLQEIKRVIQSQKSQNLEEVVLIGHSLGGSVALLAGEQFAEVTHIVALCPPASFANYAAKWDTNGFRVSRRDLPDDPHHFRTFRVPVAAALDAQNYSPLEAVSNLDKPLMIGIALEDTVVPPEETEQLVQAAKDPYVVRLEGIGHSFRHSEEESTRVMDEIEKFLKQ